ncbi:hypothetical protein N42HA_01459 [Lactococcus lactis]|uniref:Phage protein n=1 Tax=Lactococcus lactis subsp. lactis TaxID=1360 RepID=A0A0V8ESL6_LACLL|nr:DUF1642 domain-containing protein [Lactococcus lactis]KSU28886.1 Phage protein [Lactococcus lactis subsp. lactis]MDU0408446.1 hypothetical protein [Lactococcus lactis]NRD16239.1 DUF1642 domain-containing protein [Lactococcus lactis subsp. lactis]
MTKFELPEKPKKTNTSEDFNNLRKAVDELDKFDYAWKTYANKADRRINAANKHIEELERENQRLVAENLTVKTLVDSAKPQQALPVVPECVAGAIESIPDHYSAFEAIDLIKSKVEVFTEENKDWLQVYNWLCEGIDNQDTFALAFITRKYEVEKPQLFYLKNKLTGAYLYYDEATNLYSDIVGNVEDFFGTKTKFTRQEIGSMETGSYELVPVEDGE